MNDQDAIRQGVGGMLGYRFVIIAHPIANNDDDVLRAKAQEVVQQCLTILHAG